MNDHRTWVKGFLAGHGVRIVGFAAMPPGMSRQEAISEFPRAIVFGYRLSPEVLATIHDAPTLIYKHHYKTVNWLLDQTAFLLAQDLTDQGWRAIAIPASQLVDRERHLGHVSHRHLAVAAGLGYLGRHGLVVHPRYGAQVRYTSVLTDLPFEPDAPGVGSCGDCRRCIDVCPAQAITDAGVDMAACYKKLNEFAGRFGIGQHICGVCVKACRGGD